MLNITFETAISYNAFANSDGTPTAAQAVGAAHATNRRPVIYSCHLMLRNNDTVGHYVVRDQVTLKQKHYMARKALLVHHKKGNAMVTS